MSDNNLTHGREGTQRAQESNADTLLQEALELVELAQAKLSKVYWSGVRWCVVEPMAEANSRLGGACVSLKKAMRVNNWLPLENAKSSELDAAFGVAASDVNKLPEAGKP